MGRIITADYIRTFRTLAANINETRINIAIDEAEALDLMPVIGAELLEKYRTTGAELQPHEALMLTGGYYDDCDGVKHWFAGVKTTLAYFAYARFVKANSAQVTPYGVVVKDGDESHSASQQTIAELASDARTIAENYLGQTLEYWRTTQGEHIEGTGRRQRRIVAIGD